MKSGLSRFALLTVLAAGFLGGTALAQDGRASCAGRMLQGSYAFRQSGVLYAPPLARPNGDAPYIAGVSVVTFDNKGKFTILAGVNSFAGMIVPNPPNGISGTYTLDANCTGTISFMDPVGPETIFFVLADNGNRLFGLYTTPTGTQPGPVVSVDFLRQ